MGDSNGKRPSNGPVSVVGYSPIDILRIDASYSGRWYEHAYLSQNAGTASGAAGMNTLDDAIENLIDKQLVSPDEAFEKSIHKERFAAYLSSISEEHRLMLGGELESSERAAARTS